jgi:predicted acylesterase/phospholipase RssA
MSPSRIGVAFSGGGFRATLFHLGVVRYLRDADLLRKVEVITSVSGGSILAAHLVLNWSRYTATPEDFDAISSDLVRFTASDIRGRIVRRWILMWIALLPRLLSRRWELPNLLEASYDRFFKNATLGQLPAAPELHLLSTSMTTGEMCSFDRRGVWPHASQSSPRIPTPSLRLAYAVAASSAFPPLFPPIRIDHKILVCDERDFPHAEYLTDGGVYDNLGIEKMLSLRSADSPLDLLIVSDAEGNFDWAVDRSYRGIVPRNVRANDMLMRRLSLLQYKMLGPDKSWIRRLNIGGVIDEDSAQPTLDPGTQRALRNVRTDLDTFSKQEVIALIGHGYAVAQDALSTLAHQEKRTVWFGPGVTIDQVQIAWDDKQVRRSQSRKKRLWASRDWSSWATLALITLYFGVLASPVFIQQAKLYFLQTQNAVLADALETPRSTPQEREGFYIRNNAQHSVIIFVHGIFGDPVQTWTSKTGAYWPQLLTIDRAFDGFDVYAAGYNSPKFGGSSVRETAELMFLRLSNDKLFDRKRPTNPSGGSLLCVTVVKLGEWDWSIGRGVGTGQVEDARRDRIQQRMAAALFEIPAGRRLLLSGRSLGAVSRASRGRLQRYICSR